MLRPPVGPPESPGPEDHLTRVPADDGCAAWLLEAPSTEVQRLERRLEEWMKHLELRLDGLANRWPLAAPHQHPQVLPGWAQHADGHHQAYHASPRKGAAVKGSPAVCETNGHGMHQTHSTGTRSDQTSDENNYAKRGDMSPLGPRTVNFPGPVVKEGAGQDMAKDDSTKDDCDGGEVGKSVGSAGQDRAWQRITNKWRQSNHAQLQGRSLWERVVTNEYFDVIIAVVVVFNATMLGAQVNHAAIGGTDTNFFEFAEYICSGIFTLELAVRVKAIGCRKMCGPKDRLMSCVDVVLVFVSWCDVIISLTSRSVEAFGSSAFIGKLVKIIRIGRIFRVLRTVRLLGELRVMASMIFNSFRSLFWLFCILLTLSYVFALILTEGATPSLLAGPDLVHRHEELSVAFGSLFATMYSLFKSMTGGRNWGEVADLAAIFGWQYPLLVCLYIFITMFSVLNIVTGVFVDGAIELARRDRSIMVEKQAKVREASAMHLLSLLQEMDTSGDGVITLEEFDESLSREEIREFLDALHIDVHEATNIFMLLDRNEDGHVDVKEFVEGMQKLRGDAKSSDIHMLLFMTERVLISMQKMIKGRTTFGKSLSMAATPSATRDEVVRKALGIAE